MEELSKVDRLQIIREVLSTQDEDLKDNQIFAKKIGVGKSTVYSWANSKGNLTRKICEKISTALGLRYDIWTDKYYYYDITVFEHKVNQYKKINQKLQSNKDESYEKISKKIFGDIVIMSDIEKNLIKELKNRDIIDIPGNLEKHSADFIFALSYLLKEKEQIKDALNVLNKLNFLNTNFKYKYNNQINHLKAILLSSETLKKWDEAIEILKYLYANNYHLQEPEVVTLTASNYKRKSIYHPSGVFNTKEQIDIDNLAMALSLYKESYKLVEDKNKYYDAINIAYLNEMIDVLEDNKIDSSIEDNKKLLNELLNIWSVNYNNWWEVTSLIEFYLLLRDDQKAIDIYEEYIYKNNTPSKFELSTTIRQLKLYTYICNNPIAEDFLKMIM